MIPVQSQPTTASLSPGAANPMKARIFFWSITSALAGFLFGFDTVVISGAEAPERLNLLLRAGDDHGVEAEQKSGERRGDGPKKDA